MRIFRIHFWSCIFFSAIVQNLSWAQAPSALFSAPASSCQNESVIVKNNSLSASSYIWDFCFRDLEVVADVTTVTTNSAAAFGTSNGITVAYSKGQWYGFVSGRSNSNLFRIDFGSSLENLTPSVVNLGNVNNKLSGPNNLKLVEEGGIWYGLLLNYNDGSLVRLSFPSGLGSSPIAENIGNPGSWGNTRGLDLVQDGAQWVAVVCDFSGRVSLVNFGSSIQNNPTSSDVLNILSITQPIGVALQYQSGKWYALVASYGLSKVVKLTFGGSLFSTPTSTADLVSMSSPTGLVWKNEGGNFYAYVLSYGGTLYSIKFDLSLDSPPLSFTNLGTFGLFSGTIGFDIVRSQPIWYGFVISEVDGRVFKMKFQNTCPSASMNTSTSVNPVGLKFSVAGDYTIELSAYGSNGTVDLLQKSIHVQNIPAPTIDFTNATNCVSTPVIFSGSESSGQTLTSFSWDFGDGQMSGATNPSHSYGGIGAYQATLIAMSANGCTNQITKTVNIFNPPTSNFTLPTISPLCTNQQLSFVNTSTYDVGSNPTWEWFINGSSVSNSSDLLYAFNSTATQTVKLKAAIPGCMSESTQSVSSLLAGPQLGFNVTGSCEGEDIVFTNTTTDPVTNIQWDFGDLQTSTEVSPTHQYSSAGSFVVSLQGSSSNGCQNGSTTPVLIHSKPVLDFSLSLPPFSCSGTPSQFNDLTPNPSDSNLAFWAWDFDDPASGQNTSAIRNAKHTYANSGDYDVSLMVKTNFGCSAQKTKTVNVSPGPVMGFENTAACFNKGTHFTDTSSAAQTWLWQIENATYNIANPIHVFAAPGDYSVNLTVTSSNNCIGFLSKTVNVPAVLEPDFSFQKNCINQNTEFVDLTPTTSDAVVEQQWQFGTLGQSTGSPAIFKFNSTGTIPTSLTITAQSGCSYTVNRNVNIVDAPNALFTSNPEAGVPPLNVQFTNKSTNATSYLWAFNDPNSTTSTLTSPNFIFVEKGSHVVDLTAYNDLGCSSTFSKIISAILPFVDVSMIGFNLIKNDDGSIKLIASLRNEGNVSLSDLSLELNLSGDVTIRESVDEVIAPKISANHLFNYEIADPSKLEYLCATVVLKDDPSPEGNEKCITLEKSFFLYDPYPSPVVENLNIDWISNSTEVLSVAIIDAMGRQILFSTQVSEIGLNNKSIDLVMLTDGLYICIIKFGSVKETRRIVVKH